MAAERFKLAVLASGRGSNFKAIAESCTRDDYPVEVACLISDNPDAPALGIAREFGIPAHVVAIERRKGPIAAESEGEIVRLCRESGAEAVFLAGFMRIIGDVLLEAYPNRVLNVHPSLLPAFKGLRAQKQALEYGVKVAGCTVHFVDNSVDGGPIILQAAVEVRDGDDADSLAARILEQEHRIVSRAVALLARGQLQIDGRRVRVLD